MAKIYEKHWYTYFLMSEEFYIPSVRGFYKGSGKLMYWEGSAEGCRFQLEVGQSDNKFEQAESITSAKGKPYIRWKCTPTSLEKVRLSFTLRRES